MQDVNIVSYLSPHPLDDDSATEVEWVSWIPGFNHDDDVDGMGVIYNDCNVLLYQSIEKQTTESVKTGKNKRIEWLALKEIGSTDASIEVSLTIQSSKFNEIKIGSQVWMTENLNVARFRNGDLIPEAKTVDEWKKAGEEGKPAWCYYENNPANGEKYGKLYNWYAVNDPRGLAPEGWHIPSDKEWTTLIVYLGGEAVAGGKMKSTSGWNYKGNGNNSSSFSGLPGGHCNRHGSFNYFGKNGYWWSATESLTDNAWDRVLHHGDDNAYRNYYYKSNGFSVRCLND
jgi:uncharacterized protein (TIGR02145 family)